MGRERRRRQVELLAQFADRQSVGTGLDEGAEGRQPGVVAEGVEGGDGLGVIHNSIIPEIWKCVNSPPVLALCGYAAFGSPKNSTRPNASAKAAATTANATSAPVGVAAAAFASASAITVKCRKLPSATGRP